MYEQCSSGISTQVRHRPSTYKTARTGIRFGRGNQFHLNITTIDIQAFRLKHERVVNGTEVIAVNDTIQISNGIYPYRHLIIVDVNGLNYVGEIAGAVVHTVSACTSTGARCRQILFVLKPNNVCYFTIVIRLHQKDIGQVNIINTFNVHVTQWFNRWCRVINGDEFKSVCKFVSAIVGIGNFDVNFDTIIIQITHFSGITRCRSQQFCQCGAIVRRICRFGKAVVSLRQSFETSGINGIGIHLGVFGVNVYASIGNGGRVAAEVGHNDHDLCWATAICKGIKLQSAWNGAFVAGIKAGYCFSGVQRFRFRVKANTIQFKGNNSRVDAESRPIIFCAGMVRYGVFLAAIIGGYD